MKITPKIVATVVAALAVGGVGVASALASTGNAASPPAATAQPSPSESVPEQGKATSDRQDETEANESTEPAEGKETGKSDSKESGGTEKGESAENGAEDGPGGHDQETGEH